MSTSKHAPVFVVFGAVSAVIVWASPSKAQTCNNSTNCVQTQQNGTGAATFVTSKGSVALDVEDLGTGNGADISATSGNGVYATTNGGGDGVYGLSVGSPGTGAGVHGDSINSGGGWGVHGTAIGSGTGIFGENTNSGGQAGYFNGNLVYTGTLSHVSDAREKKNIAPLEGALDRVLRLRGVTFEWKDPEKHGGATSSQIGFIAQEVEKEFPEWVRTDSNGFKILSTDGLNGLVVESLRSLSAENSTLRAQQARLEARLTTLETNRRPLAAGFRDSFGLGALGMMVGAAVISWRKRVLPG